MKSFQLVLAFAAALALGACSEKAQTAGTKKADEAAYRGTTNGYTAAGWKAGDQVAWETQMRQRSQNQNEYTRMTAP